MRLFHRAALGLSQVLFSALTPLLLMPRVAASPLARRAVAFCFGKAYRGRYNRIIDTFDGLYGTPLEAGLDAALELGHTPIDVVLDCGTGTGYATLRMAARCPRALYVGMDMLELMLLQARGACRKESVRSVHALADSFSLPMRSASADLVLAMNTLPWFPEFLRVCRPGGVIVYVDSSAGWIRRVADRKVRRQAPHSLVISGRAGLGFYVVLKKQGGEDDEHPGTSR